MLAPKHVDAHANDRVRVLEVASVLLVNQPRARVNCELLVGRASCVCSRFAGVASRSYGYRSRIEDLSVDLT